MVGREVLGMRYIDAFPEARDTELPAILDRVYQRGEPFSTQEMRIPLVPSPGGPAEDHYFNFNLEPIRDVRGNVYGMMVVAVDITAQVAARNAIERSHAERASLLVAAQVASRAKDEFLAMLGHELRNPLAPILTALEMMKVKHVDVLEREREIIERQALHLVNLVDDLLDVSRVAEGKIELKKRRVSLADVVASALETASPLLERRRHTVRVEVPVSELDVDADPMRLAQVVANLLTNAARYTNPGGTVSVRAWASEQHAVLRIEDTGIGIAAEQLLSLIHI
jgi:signal transduction histidine kinase